VAGATRGSPDLVFCAAKFATTRALGSDFELVPTSVVHAKVMGTILTLCGEYSFSWIKFYDLPFAKVPADRCPKCVAALSPEKSGREL
jgi:hypothetical protein